MGELSGSGGGEFEFANRIHGGAADADVGEPMFLHCFRVEEVAAIDDDGIAHGGV